MSEALYEITKNTTALLKDRGSKFYAYSYSVHSLEEIEAYLASLRKKYYDARHHCYAYRLGAKGEHYFSTDDREPSNSAGPPILAAIRSELLTNVLVIVVRYFGGTKLGIRGLIEAYRGASEAALKQAKKQELIARTVFKLHYTYEKTADLKRILHPFEIDVIHAEYTDSCTQTLAIKEEDFAALQQKLEAAAFEAVVE